MEEHKHLPLKDVMAELEIDSTAAHRDAAATPELQPLRDLLDTLLDLGATLDDWEHLANPLQAAQADLARALQSPVFDPIRHEDEFRDPDDLE